MPLEIFLYSYLASDTLILHLHFSLKEPKTCTYEARNLISKISYLSSVDFPWKRRSSNESDSWGDPFMTSTKNDQFYNPLPHPQKWAIDQIRSHLKNIFIGNTTNGEVYIYTYKNFTI